MKVVVTSEYGFTHASRVWYEMACGMVFEVIYETEQEYYVKTGDSMNTGNFIHKSDAKVLLTD